MTRAALAAVATALVLVAPAAAAPGDVSYGKHLYGQYCLACHAANAQGRTHPGTIGAGPLREQSQQSVVAPSLRGVGALAADFYLRMGYMPLPRLGIQPRRGRVVLTEKQIRALVAYVASLGSGPAIPTPDPAKGDISQGQSLFTNNCAGCHQVVAQGGYVTGAVPPPLEDATSTQIAEAVRIGPFVMPRFTKHQISDAQLNSIIAYVQYTKHPEHPGGWSLGYLGPVPEGLVTWFIAAVALLGLCVVIGRKLRA